MRENIEGVYLVCWTKVTLCSIIKIIKSEPTALGEY